MKKNKLLILLFSVFGIISLISCDKNGDFLLFSIGDDIMLGEQVADQIANDSTFNILKREEFPESYAYIDRMMNAILSSEHITYRKKFKWTISLIDDDQTLNAFATPGGQLYVYTGLIYFLDTEDDLAGVIGHEIAHSDRRHSSKQLQRQYGISVLLSILSGGEPSVLEQIAGQIAGTGTILAFGRHAEAEADDFSVQYLSQTDYACNGAAAFFEKLLESEAQRSPEFLSTHPSPENRVKDINTMAQELKCDTSIDDGAVTRYSNFRSTLP